MTGCETVRETLVGVARGERVGGQAENSLRQHLEICAACRRQLENERRLSAGLLGLANSSPMVPPAAVKNAVMAEFRRTNRVVPIRRPVVKWVAMATAAAAILLFALVTMKRAPQTTVTAIAPPAQAPVKTPEPVQTSPVAAAKATQPVRRRRAVKVQAPSAGRAPEAPEVAPEVATDFFEIPYTEPLRPEERADVFRMQMPRANMAVFGLPVSGGRLDSRVTADVLIGEDGVARAIRFIR